MDDFVKYDVQVGLDNFKAYARRVAFNITLSSEQCAALMCVETKNMAALAAYGRSVPALRAICNKGFVKHSDPVVEGQWKRDTFERKDGIAPIYELTDAGKLMVELLKLSGF